MFKLLDLQLPTSTQQDLDRRQKKIDDLPNYSNRVAAADEAWKSQTNNKTFRVVKEILDKMCSGNRRCCYCEDSVADEIEHIKPKSLYPELVAWSNYLYTCGPCNGKKNSFFSVFDANGVMMDVTRPKSKPDKPAPVLPPAKGDAVFIDPRREDPLKFMTLDIKGKTFLFVPKGGKTSKTFIRADFTISRLGLNSRDYLPGGRSQAYEDFISRLESYLTHKNKQKP